MEVEVVKETISIGIIGDFDPSSHSHPPTNQALKHAADSLSIPLTVDWLPTESLMKPESLKVLERFDGLWASPGSPYKSMEGALRGIQFARERSRPFIGT
jgi:CTP synthase (UTP-ammonia lyase)